MALSSLIRYVEVKDSTATDGSGKSGLVFGDFTAKYLVQGGTLTTLTTETITTLGTYQAPSSSAHIRIKELNSAAPTKGIYEVHFHDSQLAAAGKKLWLFLSATGAVSVRLELDLLANDVVSINQVAASSVTTINANIGTTQPVNFTGTGSSAHVKSDLTAVLATTLTQGASGRLADAFTTMFNVVSPVFTVASVNQTGDSFGRIGASGSGLTSLATQASVDTIAGYIDTEVATIVSQTTAAAIAAAVWNAATATYGSAGTYGLLVETNLDAAVSSRLATASYTSPPSAASIAGAVWDEARSGHTSPGTFGLYLDAQVSGVGGGGGATAAEVWDYLTADADTAGSMGKLIVDYLDVAVSSRLATAGYTAPPSAGSIATAVLTTAMTESYNADGAAPTLAQSVFVVMQSLTEFAIAGTTKTVKKLDGSTTAFTETLDDADTPTSITRAT